MASTIRITEKEANHAGARYDGELSIATGLREGEGTYFYPNPYFNYEGQWQNGKKHGHGRFTLGDGHTEKNSVYEGQFRNGEMTGDGRRTWADGSSYEGQFFEGARHGNGVFEKPDGTRYEGSWVRNGYSGRGRLELSSGDSYDGDFATHQYHGQGVLTEPESSRSYQGAFERGLFEGEGRMTENGGAFTYDGQFRGGVRDGHGQGADSHSGVAYNGDWVEDQPVLRAAAWDVGMLDSEESTVPGVTSYLPSAMLLNEEAEQQLASAGADPKAKAKAKAAPKKGEVEEEQPLPGPVLEFTVGQQMPEISLRLQTADNKSVAGESARRFKVTLYRERMKPPPAGEETGETMRIVANFGDQRPATYVDPVEAEFFPPEPAKAAAPAKKGSKDAALPPEETEDAEPPNPGIEAYDGELGADGSHKLGGGESWFLPAHLKEAIHFLKVEDTTDFQGGPFQKMEDLVMPVRVKLAA